ncbi:unnamed protein product [Amoebophrya sp. A120]|nr:unnamed protein product [Amoebophrya sp. A120]|eukprot:GSA120T00012408001.1
MMKVTSPAACADSVFRSLCYAGAVVVVAVLFHEKFQQNEGGEQGRADGTNESSATKETSLATPIATCVVLLLLQSILLRLRYRFLQDLQLHATKCLYFWRQIATRGGEEEVRASNLRELAFCAYQDVLWRTTRTRGAGQLHPPKMNSTSMRTLSSLATASESDTRRTSDTTGAIMLDGEAEEHADDDVSLEIHEDVGVFDFIPVEAYSDRILALCTCARSATRCRTTTTGSVTSTSSKIEADPVLPSKSSCNSTSTSGSTSLTKAKRSANSRSPRFVQLAATAQRLDVSTNTCVDLLHGLKHYQKLTALLSNAGGRFGGEHGWTTGRTPEAFKNTTEPEANRASSRNKATAAQFSNELVQEQTPTVVLQPASSVSPFARLQLFSSPAWRSSVASTLCSNSLQAILFASSLVLALLLFFYIVEDNRSTSSAANFYALLFLHAWVIAGLYEAEQVLHRIAVEAVLRDFGEFRRGLRAVILAKNKLTEVEGSPGRGIERATRANGIKKTKTCEEKELDVISIDVEIGDAHCTPEPAFTATSRQHEDDESSAYRSTQRKAARAAAGAAFSGSAPPPKPRPRKDRIVDEEGAAAATVVEQDVLAMERTPNSLAVNHEEDLNRDNSSVGKNIRLGSSPFLFSSADRGAGCRRASTRSSSVRRYYGPVGAGLAGTKFGLSTEEWKNMKRNFNSKDVVARSRTATPRKSMTLIGRAAAQQHTSSDKPNKASGGPGRAGAAEDLQQGQRSVEMRLVLDKDLEDLRFNVEEASSARKTDRDALRATVFGKRNKYNFYRAPRTTEETRGGTIEGTRGRNEAPPAGQAKPKASPVLTVSSSSSCASSGGSASVAALEDGFLRENKETRSNSCADELPEDRITERDGLDLLADAAVNVHVDEQADDPDYSASSSSNSTSEIQSQSVFTASSKSGQESTSRKRTRRRTAGGEGKKCLGSGSSTGNAAQDQQDRTTRRTRTRTRKIRSDEGATVPPEEKAQPAQTRQYVETTSEVEDPRKQQAATALADDANNEVEGYRRSSHHDGPAALYVDQDDKDEGQLPHDVGGGDEQISMNSAVDLAALGLQDSILPEDEQDEVMSAFMSNLSVAGFSSPHEKKMRGNKWNTNNYYTYTPASVASTSRPENTARTTRDQQRPGISPRPAGILREPGPPRPQEFRFSLKPSKTAAEEDTEGTSRTAEARNKVELQEGQGETQDVDVVGGAAAARPNGITINDKINMSDWPTDQRQQEGDPGDFETADAWPPAISPYLPKPKPQISTRNALGSLKDMMRVDLSTSKMRINMNNRDAEDEGQATSRQEPDHLRTAEDAHQHQHLILEVPNGQPDTGAETRVEAEVAAQESTSCTRKDAGGASPVQPAPPPPPPSPSVMMFYKQQTDIRMTGQPAEKDCDWFGQVGVHGQFVSPQKQKGPLYQDEDLNNQKNKLVASWTSSQADHSAATPAPSASSAPHTASATNTTSQLIDNIFKKTATVAAAATKQVHQMKEMPLPTTSKEKTNKAAVERLKEKFPDTHVEFYVNVDPKPGVGGGRRSKQEDSYRDQRDLFPGTPPPAVTPRLMTVSRVQDSVSEVSKGRPVLVSSSDLRPPLDEEDQVRDNFKMNPASKDNSYTFGEQQDNDKHSNGTSRSSSSNNYKASDALSGDSNVMDLHDNSDVEQVEVVLDEQHEMVEQSAQICNDSSNFDFGQTSDDDFVPPMGSSVVKEKVDSIKSRLLTAKKQKGLGISKTDQRMRKLDFEDEEVTDKADNRTDLPVEVAPQLQVGLLELESEQGFLPPGGDNKRPARNRTITNVVKSSTALWEQEHAVQIDEKILRSFGLMSTSSASLVVKQPASPPSAPSHQIGARGSTRDDDRRGQHLRRGKQDQHPNFDRSQSVTTVEHEERQDHHLEQDRSAQNIFLPKDVDEPEPFFPTSTQLHLSEQLEDQSHRWLNDPSWSKNSVMLDNFKTSSGSSSSAQLISSIKRINEERSRALQLWEEQV